MIPCRHEFLTWLPPQARRDAERTHRCTSCGELFTWGEAERVRRVHAPAQEGGRPETPVTPHAT